MNSIRMLGYNNDKQLKKKLKYHVPAGAAEDARPRESHRQQKREKKLNNQRENQVYHHPQYHAQKDQQKTSSQKKVPWKYRMTNSKQMKAMHRKPDKHGKTPLAINSLL